MPVSIVDQIRAQQAQKQASGSGLLPLAVTAVVAFAISAAVVFGWTMLPPLTANAPSGATSKAEPGPRSWGAARVGQAETASLLRACMPFHLFGLEASERAQPADLYRLLHAGSHAARIGAVIGVQQEAAEIGLAVLWREVADCVYRQNGRMLCDPNNRALAIEAVNTFVRQADIALADAKAPPRTDGPAQAMAKLQDKRASNRLDYELQSLRSTKDRVLATLRSKVQDGRLIAADFGYLAPAAVRQTLRDAKTVRNACADERV